MTELLNLTTAAQAIRQARLDRKTIPPIFTTYGVTTIADAYAIAGLNIKSQLQDTGRRIVGKKVGLTSKAVQKQLGVDQPDFGVLFNDMEFLNAQDVPMSKLIQPKVEAEVAFVVDKDLKVANPTWSEFVMCLAYALPAIEIVDSVIQDWKISLADTVADNASSALYVLGDQPVSIGRLSLSELEMEMSVNGQVRSSGNGAACLGHPLRAAYWLAKTMSRYGDGLKEGEIILSGALGPMVQVQANDVIQVQIGALGRVGCQMV